MKLSVPHMLFINKLNKIKKMCKNDFCLRMHAQLAHI